MRYRMRPRMLVTHSSASTSELAMNRYPSPGHNNSKLCLRSTTRWTSTMSWTLMAALGDSILAAALSSLNISMRHEPRATSLRITYQRFRSCQKIYIYYIPENAHIETYQNAFPVIEIASLYYFRALTGHRLPLRCVDLSASSAQLLTSRASHRSKDPEGTAADTAT